MPALAACSDVMGIGLGLSVSGVSWQTIPGLLRALDTLGRPGTLRWMMTTNKFGLMIRDIDVAPSLNRRNLIGSFTYDWKARYRRR